MRVKLSCVSPCSTSQTGQKDMAEMAETLGVEAMTNALTPGWCQAEFALASAQVV